MLNAKLAEISRLMDQNETELDAVANVTTQPIDMDRFNRLIQERRELRGQFAWERQRNDQPKDETDVN